MIGMQQDLPEQLFTFQPCLPVHHNSRIILLVSRRHAFNCHLIGLIIIIIIIIATPCPALEPARATEDPRSPPRLLSGSCHPPTNQ